MIVKPFVVKYQFSHNGSLHGSKSTSLDMNDICGKLEEEHREGAGFFFASSTAV